MKPPPHTPLSLMSHSCQAKLRSCWLADHGHDATRTTASGFSGMNQKEPVLKQTPILYLESCAAGQGLVMMMQNRYQRRRMYTRIAMGKNRAMDVVSGESSGVAGQVVIIYPMLLALQASQFVIGEPPYQQCSKPVHQQQVGCLPPRRLSVAGPCRSCS